MKNDTITVNELEQMQEDEYMLIDMRDATTYEYGRIKGAVRMSLDEIEKQGCELPKDKKIFVYCARGVISQDAVESLREQGVDAYHIEGGYSKWLIRQMEIEMAKDQEVCAEIEKGLRKKFHRKIFSKFAKAINQYDLLQEGDKVAICISGGKDSMLMAKLFQELQRHRKFQFELVFLVMDPGYNEINRQLIESNARLMDIPITVFETEIFDTVFGIEKSPCYLCARMRRGNLYSKAKELGCNKIALGHHYDDVIETILMGMMYGAQMQTMMPKLHSTNFEGMELIRPLYLVREDDIKQWRDYHNLNFLQCACKFTDTCSLEGNTDSKRMEIKRLIRSLKEENSFIESNIFKSVENVNLSTVIAYKQDGVKHHFLDDYNKK